MWKGSSNTATCCTLQLSLLWLHGFKKLLPLHASSCLFYAAILLSSYCGGKEAMRSVRRLHVQKKTRQKSLLQKFLGESFLCLRKEKPYRIIKRFSRESKSPPKLLKPKPPMVTMATLTAGKIQLSHRKNVFAICFSRKAAVERPQISDRASAFIYTWHDLDLCCFRCCSSGHVCAWERGGACAGAGGMGRSDLFSELWI